MDLEDIAIRVAAENVTAARRKKKTKKKTKKTISRPSKKKTTRRNPSGTKNIKKGPSKSTAKPSREIERQDITRPKTEYSANMDISMSCDFEGNIAKQTLISKLKAEIVAAIESGVTSVARSFDLEPSNLRVKPVKVDFVVNDTMSLDEDDMDF